VKNGVALRGHAASRMKLSAALWLRGRALEELREVLRFASRALQRIPLPVRHPEHGPVIIQAWWVRAELGARLQVSMLRSSKRPTEASQTISHYIKLVTNRTPRSR
jgi:hypothetical protein